MKLYWGFLSVLFLFSACTGQRYGYIPKVRASKNNFHARAKAKPIQINPIQNISLKTAAITTKSEVLTPLLILPAKSKSVKNNLHMPKANKIKQFTNQKFKKQAIAHNSKQQFDIPFKTIVFALLLILAMVIVFAFSIEAFSFETITIATIIFALLLLLIIFLIAFGNITYD